MLQQVHQQPQDDTQQYIIHAIQLDHLPQSQLTNIISSDPLKYLHQLYQHLSEDHQKTLENQRDNHGEMMSVLQKKIEEIHLYLMFVLEENEETKREIDELKVQNNQIYFKLEEMTKQLNTLQVEVVSSREEKSGLISTLSKTKAFNLDLTRKQTSLQLQNSKIQGIITKLSLENTHLKNEVKELSFKYENILEESVTTQQHLKEYEILYRQQKEKNLANEGRLSSFIEHYNSKIDENQQINDENQSENHHSHDKQQKYESLNIESGINFQKDLYDLQDQQSFAGYQKYEANVLNQQSFVETQSETSNQGSQKGKEEHFYNECKLSSIKHQNKYQNQFGQECLFISPRRVLFQNVKKDKQKYDHQRQPEQRRKELRIFSIYSLNIQSNYRTQRQIKQPSITKQTLHIHNNVVSYNVQDRIQLRTYHLALTCISSLSLSISTSNAIQTYNRFDPEQHKSMKNENLQTQQENSHEGLAQKNQRPHQINNPERSIQSQQIIEDQLQNTKKYQINPTDKQNILKQSSQVPSNNEKEQQKSVNQQEQKPITKQCQAHLILNKGQQIHEEIIKQQQKQSIEIKQQQKQYLYDYIINHQAVPSNIIQQLNVCNEQFHNFIDNNHLKLSYVNTVEKCKFKKPKSIRNQLYLLFVHKQQEKIVFLMNENRIQNMQNDKNIKFKYNNNTIDSNNFKFGQSEVIISGNGHLIINRSNKKNTLSGNLEDGDWTIDSYLQFSTVAKK